jgi:hypothetical protein
MNPVATIAVMAFGILTLGSLRPCFADSALDGVYNGINKLRVNKTSYKCVDNISFTYTIANGQLLTRVGNSDVKFTGPVQPDGTFSVQATWGDVSAGQRGTRTIKGRIVGNSLTGEFESPWCLYDVSGQKP